MAAKIVSHGELEAQNTHMDITGSHEQNRELAGLAPSPESLSYLSDLRNAYRQISYSHSGRRVTQKEWQVNFAGLHRMILAKLQKELIDLVGEIAENRHEVTEDVLERIEPVLAKYTIAVRDWEHMVEHAARTDDDISRDLFVLITAKPLGRKLMMNQTIIEGEVSQPMQDWEILPGWQRRELFRKRTWRARIKRFGISIFGGVALIAPMLLMVLHHDRTTALTTTSVSTLLFAVIVASFTTSSPEAAVGAVAAYAAVLVVFVGATLPPPT